MTVLRPALLLTLLTLSVSAADAQTAKLVGVWEFVSEGSDDVEMAAFAPVLTLGADGTLQMRLTVPGFSESQPPDGTWTADGETIFATIDGREQPARYWFEKGDLYIDDDSAVIHFRRKSGC